MPAHFFANLLPIMFFAAIGIVGLAVWRVSKAKHDGIPLRWGMILIGVGLLAFLYGGLPGTHWIGSQPETFRNFFIIVAGIGANMVAGAAMVNLGKSRTSGETPKNDACKVFEQTVSDHLVVLTIAPLPPSDKPVNQEGSRETLQNNACKVFEQTVSGHLVVLTVVPPPPSDKPVN